MDFSSLGLSPAVLEGVESSSYTEPTPIQSLAIPAILQRRDIFGLAQTGTGKTASFLLPLLTLMENGRARARMPRCLIIEPTRELAAQLADSFLRYRGSLKLTHALLIGGVSMRDQSDKLMRGVDVIIATPGRFLDHCDQGRILLSGVAHLVIDEADRMLDMGFIPDIERIIKGTPSSRQTLFFSATMSEEIERLAADFARDPVRISVSPPSLAADTVVQHIVRTPAGDRDKRAALRATIAALDIANAIVFCNRKRDATVLHRSLRRHSHEVGLLHGEIDQHTRMKTLQAFRDNEIRLLVASDVAARGLDIPQVSHVLNYDVPFHAEDYIHRIGRTGRAGRSGHAVMLVDPESQPYLEAIEALIGKKLEAFPELSFERSPSPPAAESASGAEKEKARKEPRKRSRRSRSASSSKEASEERAPSAGAMRSAVEEADKATEKQPSEPTPPPASGGRAVGMGSHVPAFMRRPIAPRRPAAGKAQGGEAEDKPPTAADDGEDGKIETEIEDSRAAIGA